MDKKLILIYAATVVLLGGGAYFGRQWLIEKPQPVAAKAKDSMTNPLWYRHLSEAEMLTAARWRLDNMTRNDLPAADIGPIKDEIALLCRSEAVVDLVVERYHALKESGTAQLSAYMEIFKRFRHEKFGALVADGIRSERQAPQVNALDAAVVQRDPRLVSFLAEQLPAKSGYAGEKIIEALAAIGSTDALATCLRAVSSKDDNVAKWALTVAANAGWVEAADAMKAQTKSSDPIVRAIAAWALARIGQPSGVEILKNLALDVSNTPEGRAQAIQNLGLLDAKSTAKDLAALVDAESFPVRRESRVALLNFRDSEMLARLKNALDGNDDAKRADALAVLARSRYDEDLALVTERLTKLSQFEIADFLKDLPLGGAPGSAAFCERIARRSDDLGTLGLRQIHKFGESALVSLDRLIKEKPEHERKMQMIAAAASVGTKRAMEFCERFIADDDRRIANWAQQNVRLIEQRLITQ